MRWAGRGGTVLPARSTILTADSRKRNTKDSEKSKWEKEIQELENRRDWGRITVKNKNLDMRG